MCWPYLKFELNRLESTRRQERTLTTLPSTGAGCGHWCDVEAGRHQCQPQTTGTTRQHTTHHRKVCADEYKDGDDEEQGEATLRQHERYVHKWWLETFACEDGANSARMIHRHKACGASTAGSSAPCWRTVEPSKCTTAPMLLRPDLQPSEHDVSRSSAEHDLIFTSEDRAVVEEVTRGQNIEWFKQRMGAITSTLTQTENIRKFSAPDRRIAAERLVRTC